jgi:hypothetical protein
MSVGDFIRRITVPVGYILDPTTAGPVLPEGWASMRGRPKILAKVIS